MMIESKARATLRDAFLVALKEDKLPWHRCWNTFRPENASTGQPYRGTNSLLLSYTASEEGYEDPRWMTFLQAQAHGWSVKKGAKATPVEYWSYYDKAHKQTLTAEEVRNIQRDEPARIQDIRIISRLYSVFNGEQINGIGRWEPPQTDINLADPLVKNRSLFLSNLKVGFVEGGDRAFYQVNKDVITMPGVERFHTGYSYACTLLHEAGHATGHSSRLNRGFDQHSSTEARAREELRAEIASAFTAQSLGLPMRAGELNESVERHKAYIQSWISILEQKPDELFAAIKDAEKISDYLMEKGQLRSLAAERAEELDGRVPPEWEPKL